MSATHLLAARWDYPDPFTADFCVAAEHIDALQHTASTVYVNWCLDVAWAHTTSLGLGAQQYQQLDRAMALTRAEYDYQRATYLGDLIVAGTWITGWQKRLTMERRVQLVNPNSGDTVLRARLEFACIEISTGKPRRPPAAFIRGYSPAVIACGDVNRDP